MNENRRNGGKNTMRRNDRNERHERNERFAPKETAQEEVEGQLEGRNALTEALRAGRTIDKVFVADGETDRGLQRLAAQAKEAGAVIVPVDRRRLDTMSFTHSHQGIIALAAAHVYYTVDDILEEAASRGETPLIVICDELSDPHNLGAIMRSAECAGAHGVIIPERRAVGLTPSAVKASAGAVEYMPVAKEVNLTRTIERLKKEGIWIYGAAMNGEDYRKVNFSGAAAIVIGSEGEGISRLVAESCDKIVSLPMKGHIDSLNASVAAGILLYAVAGARA